MNAGPIQPLPRTQTDDRSDTRLASAWIGGVTEAAPPRVMPGTALALDADAPAMMPRSSEPVLVMLAGEHVAATRVLLHAADAGARVYVLAPPGWGESSADPGLAGRRKASVLVRRVPEVPVSGVLGGGAAYLWLGPSRTGPAPWRLGLDASQTAALRQVFLRLFWHHAIDEAWTGAAGLAFRAVGEGPFDVPEPTRTAPVLLLPGKPQLDASMRGALVNLTAGEPPESGPKQLWFVPSGEHHPRLTGLLRSGCEIVAGALALPDLCITSGAGRLLLPGERGRLAIDLNAAQAADLGRVLVGEPTWRFGAQVRLGDHAGQRGVRFWLAGAAAAEQLQDDQTLAIGDLHADSLRATLTLRPGSWPAPQPLALRARFSWRAMPPRLGAGSTEDPLIARWRELDGEHAARITRVRDDLTVTEHDRGRVGKAFARLMGAMLGFKRTQTELERTLDELGRACPSAAGPRRAPDLLERVAQVEARVRELWGNLADQERKAALEDERNRQELEWKMAVESARREVETRKRDLAAAQQRRPELVAELAALEVQPKHPDPKHPDPKQPDPKQPDPKQQRDLLARKKRGADELVTLDKKIQRLAAELATHEQRRDAPFVFKPPTDAGPRAPQSGARFVPAAPVTRSPDPVPAEALPEVGALRVHKRQRYLVIERWEDLAAGEPVAVRLQARLVAPEAP